MFFSVPIGVPGGKTGSMFTPVPVEVICYEPEAVAVNLCQKTIGQTKKSVVEPMKDLAQVGEASSKLSSKIFFISTVNKILNTQNPVYA